MGAPPARILTFPPSVLRVAAPFAPGLYEPLLLAGGAFWSGGFALFALACGPMLVSRRADG